MKPETYQRRDGRWGWRLRARNGRIIAVDGAQGYENRGDCEAIAARITFEGEPVTCALTVNWAEKARLAAIAAHAEKDGQ